MPASNIRMSPSATAADAALGRSLSSAKDQSMPSCFAAASIARRIPAARAASKFCSSSAAKAREGCGVDKLT